jgi:hypothetical protein
MNSHNNDVAVNFVESRSYPSKLSFHPSSKSPEYRGNGVDPENRVYAEVRDTLNMRGLDRENLS